MNSADHDSGRSRGENALPEVSSDNRIERWRRFAVRLGFELLVVFAGVYGAFGLAERERAQEAAERRQQLRLALIQEIEAIVANMVPAAVFGDSLSADLRRAAGR